MEAQVAARPFVSPYSYAHFARAELYRSRGDWTAAVASYQQALVGADPEPHALVRYAEALGRSKRPEAALSALLEAEAIAPGSSEIRLARARIERNRGQLKAAFAAFQQAIDARPLRADAALEFASLLTDNGDPEGGMAVLARFAASAPELAVEMHRARLQLGIQLNNPALVSSAATALAASAEYSHELLEASRVQLQAGDCGHALALVNAIPDDATSAPQRIQVLLTCRALEEASDLLLRYPNATWDKPNELARAWLAVGLYGRALETAQAAELIHHDNFERESDAKAIANQARAALARPQLDRLMNLVVSAVRLALEALAFNSR